MMQHLLLHTISENCIEAHRYASLKYMSVWYMRVSCLKNNFTFYVPIILYRVIEMCAIFYRNSQ